MNITTKLTPGDTVIAEVDGSCVKAKICGLSYYLPPDKDEPVINYPCIAKIPIRTTDKDGKIVEQIHERIVIYSEQYYIANLQLYADVKKEVKDPTDNKILWKMTLRLQKQREVARKG